MTLSLSIARTESALDQGIASGETINMATISSLQSAMLVWSGEAKEQEEQLALLQAENANLRALMKMPGDLAPSVFTGNVVPLGST